jgi:hypothetical protein
MKKILIYFLLLFVFCSLFAQKGSVSFEKNKGQWNKDILYQARLSLGRVMIRKDRVTMVVFDTNNAYVSHHNENPLERKHNNDKERYDVFSLIPQNANLTTIEEGNEERGYSNYFIGNDKSKWKQE